MDTTKLINFLGYTSIYEPFDDYLLSIGIKKRPKDTSLKSRIIEADNLSLRFLEYDDYVEDYLSEPLSEGQLILERVSFEAGCSDPLPFGLSFNMNLETVINTLGEPLKVVVEGIDQKEPWIPYFYLKGFLVVVRFNQKTLDMEDVFVSRPDKYNREHFGLK